MHKQSLDINSKMGKAHLHIEQIITKESFIPTPRTLLSFSEGLRSSPGCLECFRVSYSFRRTEGTLRSQWTPSLLSTDAGPGLSCLVI